MDTRGKIVLIITTFLVGVPAATSASAAEPDDIVNYRGYSDRLASSGQPTRSQFPGLKEAGFERVVFLAFTDHDEIGAARGSDRVAARHGLCPDSG
jgi:hypothetical protein